MRELKFEVSDWDLTMAERKSSNGCAIAFALRRQYPQFTNISVDIQQVRVSDRERREQLTFLTPERARRAILEFDEGGKLQPFTLRLREPRVRKMAERREGHGPEARGKSTVHKPKDPSGLYRIGRRRVHGMRAVGRMQPEGAEAKK